AGKDKLVLIPKGRFVLSDMLEITQPRIVLRGAGPEQTVLIFTRSLQEIKPTTASTGDGKTTTAYSWSGGLINVVAGASKRRARVPVTAEARRADIATPSLRSHRYPRAL